MRVYNGVAFGELAGSATAEQMPDLACQQVWFKAEAANAGNVYIGPAGVTVFSETTSTTSGIQLDAGDQIGPIPVNNLNLFWRICDNAGDDLTFMAVGGFRTLDGDGDFAWSQQTGLIAVLL